MREAIDKLMADFNTFIQENAVFKGYFIVIICRFALTGATGTVQQI